MTHTSTLNAQFLQSKAAAALDWSAYLATDPAKADAWAKVYEQTRLSDDQQKLIAGFTRQMHMLILTGIWCGDCAQQCPLLQRIAEANPGCLHLHWLDRDEHSDLMDLATINAGARVPVVILAAEDFEPVAVRGDRTLTRYRAIAAKQLGASCPLPGAPVPQDELDATLQDWLDEIERVHLLLRLSGRLRQTHGD